MKKNMHKLLSQYKSRIKEIENKEKQIDKIEKEIAKLVIKREEKREELKRYSEEDIFYKDIQYNIDLIQKNIDDKNEKIKQLRDELNNQKIEIIEEIRERVQGQKTELNKQLEQGKISKGEKLKNSTKYYNDIIRDTTIKPGANIDEKTKESFKNVEEYIADKKRARKCFIPIVDEKTKGKLAKVSKDYSENEKRKGKKVTNKNVLEI